MAFNVDKFIAKHEDKDDIVFEEEDFTKEGEDELIELISKEGTINDVTYHISTGKVNNKV